MAAVAFAVAALGPGPISLDHAFGIHWAGLKWALGAAVGGGLGGLIAFALAGSRAGRSAASRRRTQPKVRERLFVASGRSHHSERAARTPGSQCSAFSDTSTVVSIA